MPLQRYKFLSKSQRVTVHLDIGGVLPIVDRHKRRPPFCLIAVHACHSHDLLVD